MKRYVIRDREAGNIIESFTHLSEAKKCVELFETEDRINNTFEPDFYEIYDTEKEIAVN